MSDDDNEAESFIVISSDEEDDEQAIVISSDEEDDEQLEFTIPEWNAYCLQHGYDGYSYTLLLMERNFVFFLGVLLLYFFSLFCHLISTFNLSVANVVRSGLSRLETNCTNSIACSSLW